MIDHVALTLCFDEVRLVEQLLRGDRSRLDDETNHTDTREFREFLKRREETLDSVLVKLHS